MSIDAKVFGKTPLAVWETTKVRGERVMRALCVALVIMAVVPALAEKPRFEREYDRFDDVTKLRVSPKAEKPGGRVELGVTAILRGKKGPVTGRPMLVFFSAGKAWRFEDCYATKMLVDGLPLELGEATHRGGVADGVVVERIIIPTSVEQMTALASAKKVEVKICEHTFALQESDLTALREMVRALHFSAGESVDDNQELRLSKLKDLQKIVECNIQHRQEATAAVVRECGRYLEP